MMVAAPVGVSQVPTSEASMPSEAQSSRAILPKASSPSLEKNCVLAPARAQATAWLEPLPPGPRAKDEPIRVSPQAGRRAARKARSATKLPMTRTVLLMRIEAPWKLKDQLVRAGNKDDGENVGG